ncbi:hypothetical protein KOW79_013406 [Hemibagrus wyckioides]|uniref:Uncharacterized protein n=1 Tax=Hemibagrus wyckioides TaxID=337641 RepID=A0A9D3SLK5_9TELE|nr:hypothetical protein KOW79_013406 [Hemibagrus wyckioides]
MCLTDASNQRKTMFLETRQTVLDKLRLSCGLGNDDLLPKSWTADDLQMTDGAKKKCAEISREIRRDDVT